MAGPGKLRFETQVIHAAQSAKDWQGATLAPIYQSAAHAHPTAESLSRAFAGQSGDHVYMRLTNPTNRVLEEKLSVLEGGAGALVFSSGMAAISSACMALLRAGDEFVAGRSLFLSTYTLFTTIFKQYDIQVRLIDLSDPDALDAAVNEKTRFVYLETIGNPRMDVPDLARVAEAAHALDLPVMVDNTLASPWLCRPIERGVDVVLHSTTKYLSGHGAAIGGAVIDAGRFHWPETRFPDFAPFLERKGPLAFLDKVWREQQVNFGATQAPFHSFLTMIGLDTLAVRMPRHQENALAAARFLKDRPEVAWVNYPGLAEHPDHTLADRQFGGRGFGGLLTFGLDDQKTCRAFIDRLELIQNLANLGDCKTLIIHPCSTQYNAFDEKTRSELGIADSLLRLSVGIEHVDDILEDIEQALNRTGG